MRVARIVAIGVTAVALLLAAAIVYVMSIDFDRYRPLLAERVKAATGRDFAIAGRLDLTLSLTPTVAVSDVRVANPPGFSRPDMATIAKLEGQIALWPLLSGRVQIERFTLSGADIIVETDAQGRGNWLLGPTAAPPASTEPGRSLTLAVGAVTIRDSTLTYRDGRSGAEQRLALASATLQASGDGSTLDIAFKGAVDAVPFDIAGKTGGLTALLDGTTPWPVALTATIDKVTATLDGTIAHPRAGKGIALDVTVAADRLADLGLLAGATLPASGPFKLAGHLSDSDGRFAVDRLDARLGASDLKGRLEVTPGARPRLAATLDADRLALVDFTGPAAASRPQGKADRVFSADPLPFAALKTVDVALTLAARQLVAAAATLDNFAVDLALADGLLDLRKVAGQFRGSPFTLAATIDARPAVPLVSATGKLDKFDLGGFLKAMAETDLLTGAVDLDLTGRGAGISLRQIMAGVDGRLVAVMGKAELATPLFDLIGADLAQSVLPWAAQDRSTHINCAVVRFDARRGTATSDAMLLDTEKVTMQGAGTVDLASERIALVLTPEPKERSLISLATPIDVGGTLAAPTLTPDRMALAKGAAGAVIGNVIIPFGFLVPLISGGTGNENPCVAALAQAKASGSSARPGAAVQPRPGESGIGGALQGVGKGLRNLFGN
ncbi:MAG TPA: AsmA family protein [Stellaceae bacterium]|nr:AsmA family protein [Stellaceae bacterium]